jgi:hypothetical protein
LKRLSVDIDGDDFGGGVALHAELRGIADWLRDLGDEPSSSQSPPADAANRAPISLNTKERESLLKLVIGWP